MFYILFRGNSWGLGVVDFSEWCTGAHTVDIADADAGAAAAAPLLLLLLLLLLAASSSSCYYYYYYWYSWSCSTHRHILNELIYLIFRSISTFGFGLLKSEQYERPGPVAERTQLRWELFARGTEKPGAPRWSERWLKRAQAGGAGEWKPTIWFYRMDLWNDCITISCSIFYLIFRRNPWKIVCSGHYRWSYHNHPSTGNHLLLQNYEGRSPTV